MPVIIDPASLQDDEIFRRLIILQVTSNCINKNLTTYASARWAIDYADSIIKELKKDSDKK